MLVKAKCMRETVKDLAKVDDNIIEDEQEILSGVHSHYAFTKKTLGFPCVRRICAQVLGHIMWKFSVVDNLTLKIAI